jgi:5-(carboxyamino)imidazole ribonucleotide mutase
MLAYADSAHRRGLRVMIAGAGGGARLPGMIAAATSLPVIGVPVPLRQLDGLDSLLSIAQMRVGVPVATVAIAGARNAGLLVRILATADPALPEWVRAFQAQLAGSARPTDAHVRTDTDNQGA